MNQYSLLSLPRASLCVSYSSYFLLVADETSYSEDDGWEFITLADQVSCFIACDSVHVCVYVYVYV